MNHEYYGEGGAKLWNDEQFVKQRHPDAMLHPIQSHPKAPIKWHVLPHPSAGAIIGSGNNEQEAWKDAAKRINQWESRGLN